MVVTDKVKRNEKYKFKKQQKKTMNVGEGKNNICRVQSIQCKKIRHYIDIK